MFRRQPLFYTILMCSTFYFLQTPALRCRSNAGGRASGPPAVSKRNHPMPPDVRKKVHALSAVCISPNSNGTIAGS